MVASPQCDSRQLQQLLRNELSDAEENRATQHVETCTSCRAQLEEFAAETTWWLEAGRHLRGSTWQDDGTLRLTPNGEAAGSSERSSGIPEESWMATLAFLEPSDNPAMLGRLGGFEILDVIGSGGFGIVLRGFDRELNRYVAVKVLAPHLAHSAAARKRFAREAKAAAAVVHPHVVAIHTVDSSVNLPYLVMPYIAGESLQQRLDRQGSLGINEILRIGMQAAQGLAAAHAQGLVHRDIKPGNILLEHGVDRVMLTDFGLARAMDDAGLTRSTVIAGTPQYMSPEQARGDSIDHRSDLFSLGSVIYAMCTGHPSFRAETMMGVLRRIADSTPRDVREINADIPEWLVSIIRKLHETEPARRFQSGAEVAVLLEQCLAHVQQPTAVTLPTIPGMARTISKNNKTLVLGGVALASVLLLMGVAVVWNWAVNGRPDQPSPSSGAQTPSVIVEKSDSQASVNQASESVSSTTTNELDWNDDVEQDLFRIECQLQWLESFQDH